MGRILVVANETIAGEHLIEAVRRRAGEGDAEVVVCVPRTRPHHGSIIYDDFVAQAAQVRVDLACAYLRDLGIPAIGEVGDPDPFTATMDAIREFEPDEIIVSTKPATVSGWLRRDLVDRIREATTLPVEHVVTDLDREGLPFTVTLVIANRTASTDALSSHLTARAAGEERDKRLFIVVVPQEGGEGHHAHRARGRLGQLLDRLRSEELLAAGMIGDPDPYTAAKNALQLFRADEVIVSTFGPQRSRWLRADLVERIRKASPVPVEHLIAEDREQASVS